MSGIWKKKRLTRRQQIHRLVVGSLRDTIRIHGPITKLRIGSAAKRIVGMVLAREKKDE